MSIQEIAIMVGILSTTIGIFTTAVALIVSLSKWRTALREQTRRYRLESARMAWKLANSLHEEPIASNALELIDSETSRVSTPNHGEHEVTDEDIKSALSVDSHDPTEKAAAIRYTFDSMFYALDRLRSAMEAGLINLDDISSATIYYCEKLVTNKNFVLAYGAKYAYSSTVKFVEKLALLPTNANMG